MIRDSALNKDALDFYAGKTILITGGAGFIASNVVRLLCDAKGLILRLDRHGTVFSPIKGKAEIKDIFGDVRERNIWKDLIPGVDVIFHFAAQTSTYVANADPGADIRINVAPMVHLLETCRISPKRPTVLFSSTVTVAGIPASLPVDETHPDNPVTIYDLHKLIAEQYLRYYVNEGVVDGVILRLANIYGPGPKSGSSDRGILNLMAHRALAGVPLTVYGKGNQIRDYLYVEDAARAFLTAAIHAGKLNGRHFVIGSEQGYTISQAMHLISERAALKTGIHTPVTHIDPPSPQSTIESRSFIANSKLFRESTGWQARYSLAEGVDRTLEVFL
jgi:nucleoside-diphosphate-sugar epimerase